MLTPQSFLQYLLEETGVAIVQPPWKRSVVHECAFVLQAAITLVTLVIVVFGILFRTKDSFVLKPRELIRTGES